MIHDTNSNRDTLPVAVVTGSSRGLGRGIAEHFLREGYWVFGCSRGSCTLRDERYEHSCVDVGVEGQVCEWIRNVNRIAGRIDVVVNNAGLHLASYTLITSLCSADAVVKTNFLGAFILCREAAKVMVRRKTGRIINISSIAVSLNSEGTSIYSASKCALVGFSKILAKELASFGITCNVIGLSILDTGITARLSREVADRVMQHLAIKRHATIEDVCNAVSFFASPVSGYITGQVLNLGYVD